LLFFTMLKSEIVIKSIELIDNNKNKAHFYVC
jgi:hypothetical protein